MYRYGNKNVVLGCVNPPLAAVASSRNLGHTFFCHICTSQTEQYPLQTQFCVKKCYSTAEDKQEGGGGKSSALLLSVLSSVAEKLQQSESGIGRKSIVSSLFSDSPNGAVICAYFCFPLFSFPRAVFYRPESFAVD